MTTYNLEIEQLSDKLKCTQCKLVLKDACQLPCCCRFCRVCIDDMIERGGEFCPGYSDECGESLLSCYQSNLVANKGVSRLTVKCPHDGCVHKCQLANIEEHLPECPRKDEECPFYELGCKQDKLAADEMGGHLQHANRRHSEILIRMIANINREIESLKQRDVVNTREIETLKGRDEASSREIETLKQELVQKDGQIRSIMDQMIHLQNDIKLIQEEKEDLAGRVTILTEKIDREIAERRENDELYLAGVIEHVDKEITAVTRLIGSNNDMSAIEMQSVRGDIGSINQSVQSIKDDICSVKSQVQSVQEEKEDLAGRVTILTEKIDREIAERRENEELYLAGVIENVDKEIAAVTRLIGSNNDMSAIAMQSVRGDIGSINQSVQSIKDDICSVKSQVQSVQNNPILHSDIIFHDPVEASVSRLTI